MRKWLRHFVVPTTLFFVAVTILSACAETLLNGPVQMTAIVPTGAHCEYTIGPTRLETLQSLNRVSGKVGQVVYLNEEVGSRPEILDNFDGFSPVDALFGGGGDSYSPLDFASLFAVSLYNAAETGYRLFRDADPSTDMLAVVPDLFETRIVHHARRIIEEFSETDEVTDNAEFKAVRVDNGGAVTVRNYLFSFPTKDVEALPLGLNLGIMVHEYTHLVFHHVFWEKLFRAYTAGSVDVESDSEAIRAIRAIDEGNADYMGYMAALDPNYFACSYPDADRDISVPKALTSAMQSSIQSGTNFDPHEGGAVWAAALYRVALANGPNGKFLVAKALARFMASLFTGSSGGTFTFSMSQAAGAFQQAAGAVGLNASAMSQAMAGQ